MTLTDEKIKDMRVIKGSLIDAFDTMNILREVHGDTVEQQKQVLLEVRHYLSRWTELARGSYNPNPN